MRQHMAEMTRAHALTDCNGRSTQLQHRIQILPTRITSAIRPAYHSFPPMLCLKRASTRSFVASARSDMPAHHAKPAHRLISESCTWTEPKLPNSPSSCPSGHLVRRRQHLLEGVANSIRLSGCRLSFDQPFLQGREGIAREDVLFSCTSSFFAHIFPCSPFSARNNVTEKKTVWRIPALDTPF